MSVPRWVPFAVLGAVLLVAASGLLFSTFMMYDDEGYVLFSLQSFADGGGLYERVYSQYGPFFYIFHQALHFLGLEFSNNGSRLLTLFNWLATSGLCGAIVWRLTRSTAATIFAIGGVFLHLWTLISEPSHPGGFIVFTISLLGWLGTIWSEQPRRVALAAGAIGAALFLTKINVGVFLFAGAGAWWALHLNAATPGLRLRAAVVGLAMAVMPFALMRTQIGLDWVMAFAAIVAIGGIATVIVTAHRAPPLARWSDLACFGAAAAGVVLLTGVAIVAQGTSFHGLLDGVLLGPLRHPQAYTHHVVWRMGALPLAVVSLAVAIWSIVRPSRAARQIVAGARLLIVVAFFVTWVLTLSLNTHAFALSYAVSTAWLFVFPLEEDRTRSVNPAWAWLALLLVPQALHAYPVAGSQISWGTFLWIPLAIAGAHDAIRVLTAEWMPSRQKLLSVAAALLAVVTIGRCANYAWLGVTRLQQSDSLGLPGTSLLRLPENFATTMRVLTLNARVHADVLFSLPGMLSFHRWTGVPPPTTHNTTHWFTLLSPAQQEAIRQKLEASPRSCIIVQRHIYQFLLDTKVATESPLNVWLHANYEPAFKLDSYEFLVRKGRSIAPLGTATIREAAPGVTPRYLINVTLAAPTLNEVVAIELDHFVGDTGTKVATWTGANAKLSITPLASNGGGTGPAREATFPFSASGLIQIGLLTDSFPPRVGPDQAVVYLLDRAGQRVAEARFVR